MRKSKKICFETQSVFEFNKKKEELPEDISSHLENCPECLLIFNRDLNFRKRLKEAVQRTTVPLTLEVSIREFIKKEESLARLAGETG
jgi:hypothetical protein